MQIQRFVFSWFDDPSLRLILPFVLAVHVILIIWAALFAPVIPPLIKPVEQRLIVKTVSLQPQEPPRPMPKQEVALVEEPPQVIQETIPEPLVEKTTVIETPLEPIPQLIEVPKPETIPPKKTPEIKKPTPKKEVVQKEKAKVPPKKEQKPIAKKETVKKPDPKPVAQVNKTPPKKVQPPVKPKVDARAEAVKTQQRKLLAQAQENIAKISQSRDKITAVKTSASSLPGPKIPGPVDKLQIDALPGVELKALSKSETSYCDELASRLKLLLRLPEYGAVKVKLTLDRTGQFIKVSVVSAESNANRNYIEKTLPTMRYPSFGGNFGELGQYTFVITLSNDL